MRGRIATSHIKKYITHHLSSFPFTANLLYDYFYVNYRVYCVYHKTLLPSPPLPSPPLLPLSYPVCVRNVTSLISFHPHATLPHLPRIWLSQIYSQKNQKITSSSTHQINHIENSNLVSDPSSAHLPCY